jgi:hypothetical protein
MKGEDNWRLFFANLYCNQGVKIAARFLAKINGSFLYTLEWLFFLFFC